MEDSIVGMSSVVLLGQATSALDVLSQRYDGGYKSGEKPTYLEVVFDYEAAGLPIMRNNYFHSLFFASVCWTPLVFATRLANTPFRVS